VARSALRAALALCLFSGLVPPWQTARADFVSALKSGAHGSSGSRRTFGRDLLVTGQIALAMVILIAAGMSLAGFRNLLGKPPECRAEHLITFYLASDGVHYSPH